MSWQYFTKVFPVTRDSEFQAVIDHLPGTIRKSDNFLGRRSQHPVYVIDGTSVQGLDYTARISMLKENVNGRDIHQIEIGVGNVDDERVKLLKSSLVNSIKEGLANPIPSGTGVAPLV